MELDTILALTLGTVVECILAMFMMRAYKIAAWKSIPAALATTFVGTIGAYLWHMVESSSFGGRSYYGAVLLIPIAFVGLAKLLRVPYRDLMDITAPFGTITLVVMKYACLRSGCCGGCVLMDHPMGGAIRFPSQIVEACLGIVLTVVLVCLSRKEKNRGKIYGWFLLLYGASRFVLNFFRANTEPFLAWLPNGHVWSLIAVFAGILWITDRKLAIVKRTQDTKISEIDTPDDHS